MNQVNGLSSYRKRCKLSQETVAEELGISRQTLSRWERGETEIPALYLPKLAELYGVSISDLLNDIPGAAYTINAGSSLECSEEKRPETAETLSVSTSKKLHCRNTFLLCLVCLAMILVGMIFYACRDREKQDLKQGGYVSQNNMQTDHIDPDDGSNFDMEWPDV